MGQIRIRYIGQSKIANAAFYTPVKPTIAFEDGPARGLSVLATLGEMGQFVASVLEQLSLFVPEGYVKRQGVVISL